MEEMGLGFFIGALAGFLVAGVVFLIVTVSRRAADRAKAAPEAPPSHPPSESKTTIKPVAAAAQTAQAAPRAVQKTRQVGNTTIVVDALDVRDELLNRSIHEVRELILRLAEVVVKTDAASGQANETFSAIRKTIDDLDLQAQDGFAEAQQLLVREIDRVLKTNASLQSELDKANRGIAEQRAQIEELRLAARMDALTRIPNRAAFDERLREYTALAQRGKMNFSLLLLDIDHFKKINDEHGHPNGDRILRGVATKIGENIRTNDFAARYGGEEFAVLFPATGLAEAANVAERMRQDIARTNFRLDGNVVRMTVSGGLAEYAPGKSIEETVQKADNALYQAKRSGRNSIFTDVAAVTKGATGNKPKDNTKPQEA